MEHNQFDDFTLDMADLTADVIQQIVLIADRHNKDRDSAFENFAAVIKDLSDKYSLDEYDPEADVLNVVSKN